MVCIACNDFVSGCPNQEIGWAFLFKELIIRTSSYFGADSATKKTLIACLLLMAVTILLDDPGFVESSLSSSSLSSSSSSLSSSCL
jgi:hypothetical protein